MLFRSIACVAAPRICPPGARAKVLILFLHRPLSPGSPAKSFAGVTQSGQSASPTKRKPVVRIHPPAPSVAVVLRVQHSRLWPSQYGFKSHRSPQLPCPCRLTARIAPFQGADDSSILSTGIRRLAASGEAAPGWTGATRWPSSSQNGQVLRHGGVQVRSSASG